MAILSIEIDLEMLDQALGRKGLVADFNDPENKIVLPAEGSDVTDELILATAKSLEKSVIARRLEATEKQKVSEDTKAELLNRLGITADEAKLLLS